MVEIVEYLAEEGLRLGRVEREEGKKLVLADARGRTSKVGADKVLFRHRAESIEQLQARLDEVTAEVDVPFLWEALLAESQTEAAEARKLALLFFDDDDALHCSAVFRALAAEQLHFRRRAKTFTPRTPEELASLREQRSAEARAAAETERLTTALTRRALDDELAERLERFVRGAADKQLEQVLGQLARDPQRHAFGLLIDGGRLPAHSDLEVVAANLVADHPAPVLEQAQAAPPPLDRPRCRCAMSIDDPWTREVDDAINVERDGELWRVDVDIADGAHHVDFGDAVDREAFRRATTVYLPTGTYYMLPEAIGAGRGSLAAGKERAALRTSIWFDDEGELIRHQLSRIATTVEERLDYDRADALLRDPDDSDASVALAQLARIAERLQKARRERGALRIRRREWRIRVTDDGETVDVAELPQDSPSRDLVAEMMILTNGLAARTAVEARVPIIFRAQPPPTDPLPPIDPDDPAAFVKLRGLIAPAALSLHPASHWALGLDAYTQVTSPLRRYGDLVQQRQLSAHLAGERPPYDADGLLKVLATVESTEQEMKRVEAAVTQRWAMEYVARLPDKHGHEAMIMAETNNGFRAQLLCCGAQGLASAPKKSAFEVGQQVRVDIEDVRPRRGQLRLRLPRG